MAVQPSSPPRRKETNSTRDAEVFGTRDVVVFGHSISQACFQPNDGREHDLVSMQISHDFKQSRSLLYHPFCDSHILAGDGQTHPAKRPLPEDGKHAAYTSAMEITSYGNASLSYLGHRPWWSTLIEMQALTILGRFILFSDDTVY